MRATFPARLRAAVAQGLCFEIKEATGWPSTVFLRACKAYSLLIPLAMMHILRGSEWLFIRNISLLDFLCIQDTLDNILDSSCGNLRLVQ